MRSLKFELAAKTLWQGGVVAYPTETVWGLGCNPHDSQATDRLLQLKQRQPSKGLILVAADIQQLSPYLQGLPQQLLNKLLSSWPGPITWLVPDNGFTPSWIKGQHNKVALRVSANQNVADLCCSFGGPIVSTSANISGLPILRREWQLRRCFGRGIDFYLSGDPGNKSSNNDSAGNASKPTEIRDLLSDKILRQS